MPSYAAAYSVGDPVYIFTDVGTGVLTSVDTVSLREGFNPAAYVAATDMIYTLVATDVLGEKLKRAEGLTFATKAEAQAYIDTLP